MEIINEKEISENHLQSVATEINFLKLPIFKATNITVSDKIIVISEIIDNNIYHIEISHGGNLGGFDRKVLLVLEALYIKQNPEFKSNKVITNFVEIARILGLHPNTATQIWESLSKLNEVQIKADITINNGQKLLDINSKFNLLASVTKVFSKQLDKSRRRKAGTVEIELNRWHVDNFRNRYYRVVNLGLATQLQSAIAIRLFDYLNLKAFYFDKKAKKYRQKLKIRISYRDLVNYLHIANRPNLSEIKKQFRTSLRELQSKGVLRSYEFEKTPAGVFLIFYLARSINWREVEPEQFEKLLLQTKTKKDGIEQDLEEIGLGRRQIDKIMSDHPKNHIKGKINQLKYLLKFASHKVKGQGSYLYQSIIDDWKDDSYEAHLRERKIVQKDITKRSMERLEQQYDKYVADTCQQYYNSLPAGEKELIENQIEKSLEGFKEKIEGTRSFMHEAKRGEILRQTVDLMSFQEFCERRQVEKEQLALFDFDE